jgi:hypothetical protein
MFTIARLERIMQALRRRLPIQASAQGVAPAVLFGIAQGRKTPGFIRHIPDRSCCATEHSLKRSRKIRYVDEVR